MGPPKITLAVTMAVTALHTNPMPLVELLFPMFIPYRSWQGQHMADCLAAHAAKRFEREPA
jgi:hypothetical protein